VAAAQIGAVGATAGIDSQHAAEAQGIPGGMERGAREGNRVAGPVGGIVGGAVGGAGSRRVTPAGPRPASAIVAVPAMGAVVAAAQIGARPPRPLPSPAPPLSLRRVAGRRE
jgi:hypothetical protein